MGTMHFLVGIAWFCFVVASDIEETPCTEYELPCDGGGCIDKGLWCNNSTDCADRSDEAFCSWTENQNILCREHHMRCEDGSCIPLGSKCDGYEDCPDGSDESRKLCGYLRNDARSSGTEISGSNTASIRKAVEWILSQRNKTSGWGADTERAVIALFLTNSQRFQSSKEGNLIKKQLSIHITSTLLRNATEEVNLGKLANYVNALIASCNDPRSFQGSDLLRVLRARTNSKRNVNAPIPPLVYLTLCLTGMSSPNDFRDLYAFKNDSAKNKTDIEAVALIALMCLAQEKSDKLGSKSSDEKMMHVLARNLSAKFEVLNKRSVDPYTTALVIQALNAVGYESWNKTSALRRLASYQKPDGGFGDILATYYALPALAGKSLMALKYITCPSETQGLKVQDPTSQSQKNIKYSLWLGNPVARSHTVNLKIDANWTVIDMMTYAAEKNELFSFRYEDTPQGPSVYSIAGIPNDAEREFQWFLERGSDAKSQSAQNLVPVGLYSKPEAGDHLVMWYKTSKRQNGT